jgi:hypothetical protein
LVAALRRRSILLLPLALAGCGDRTPPPLWPEPPPPTLARPIGGPAGGHGPATAPLGGAATIERERSGPGTPAPEPQPAPDEAPESAGGRVPPAPLAVPERPPRGSSISTE